MSLVGALWLPGSVLGAPALFLAGAAASPHCALMCGSLAVHQARAGNRLGTLPGVAWTQLGRLIGYGLLGAVAGALGQSLPSVLPDVVWGRGLQLLAASTLVGVGAWIAFAPSRKQAACCQPPALAIGIGWPSQIRQLLRGLAWAGLPCGLLYSVLLLSALSGAAWNGALLAAAFALGGMPMLGAISWLARHHASTRLASLASGGWLIGLGTLALIVGLGGGSEALAWCATPR